PHSGWPGGGGPSGRACRRRAIMWPLGSFDLVQRNCPAVFGATSSPAMLSFLPPVLRGLVAAVLLALDTLFWCGLLFRLALVKLALPFAAVRRGIDPMLNAVAANWISGNSAWMRLTQKSEWDVAGVEGLDYRGWYMVNANHQSWVDIFVLQHV